MLVWALGTIMALVGVAEIALGTFSNSPVTGNSFFLYLSLFIGGFVAIIISETVFGMNKTKVEMERDKTIKTAFEKNVETPTTLAICWNCRNRIPADSKYCLECGADLKPSTSPLKTS